MQSFNFGFILTSCSAQSKYEHPKSQRSGILLEINIFYIEFVVVGAILKKGKYSELSFDTGTLFEKIGCKNQRIRSLITTFYFTKSC